MQWNSGYNERAVLYQQHPQRDGGTHLTGLRAAMTRVIGKYIESNELAKKPGGSQRRRYARGPVLRAQREGA